MSSFRFSVVLLIVLIHGQDSANIRHVDLDQHKRIKGTGLEYVVHKYLNPLRRLTAELPNHAIEMQIEILDQVPTSSASPVPQRRLIRVLNRQPKKIARANEGSSSPVILKQGPERPGDNTTTSLANVTSSPVTDKSTTPAAPPMEQNKPVYMEDLEKALTNLEKRLEEKQARKNIAKTPRSQPPPLRENNLVPCNEGQNSVRNIDDILAILRKAVHIEKHVPQPNDDNLEWVQIKIPKK